MIINSKWLYNGTSIYYSGGKLGIGTSAPVTVIDIAGGNNWDVINGDGDLRLGNSQYRLKMGIALSGGGAGATGIMQHGQPGGYNVLSLGAQGHKLLYLNGETQRVGIGTDAPLASFDIHGTFALVDGSQGTGKVLKSDAGGVASWVTEGNASTHAIGESFGGGIVFYVYDSGRHGLIAATTNQSTAAQWYNGTYLIVNAARNGFGAGMYDTERIIAAQGTGNYAAEVSANYSGGNFGDWYLPSKHELNLLYLQQAAVGGFAGETYWSSSEAGEGFAWQQFFNTGFQYDGIKSGAFCVRAIRAF
jgi:hypothetical protein